MILCALALLHSEWPKLYGVLAILRAIVLMHVLALLSATGLKDLMKSLIYDVLNNWALFATFSAHDKARYIQLSLFFFGCI